MLNLFSSKIQIKLYNIYNLKKEKLTSNISSFCDIIYRYIGMRAQILFRRKEQIDDVHQIFRTHNCSIVYCNYNR